eukprot:COSAG02_NODE_12331_length_1561_cov_1.930917_1_plen_418_part_00
MDRNPLDRPLFSTEAAVPAALVPGVVAASRETDVNTQRWSEQLCPGPRDFWLTDTAARVLGLPWFLPAAFTSTTVLGICMIVCPQVYDIDVNTGHTASCSLTDAQPLAIIGSTFVALGRVILIGTLVGFSRVTNNDDNTKSGELVQLGAGSRMIAAPSIDRRFRVIRQVIHIVNGLHLRGCAKFWTVLNFLMSVPMGMYNCYWMLFAVHNGNWLYAIPYGIPLAVYNLFIAPLVVAWYVVLKQAAALATARVTNVKRSIECFNPMDTEWESEVVAEIRVLVTETFPLLSSGWAIPSAFVVVACWLLTVSQVCTILQGLSTLQLQGLDLLGNAVFCFIFVTVPALILFDMAVASTECDGLVKALNDKRIAGISDESHTSIYKLEIMLGHLNKVRARKQDGVPLPLICTVCDATCRIKA